MALKPQDILILLKLVTMGAKPWSYNGLANELFMSPSETHSGIKRATMARLFDVSRNIPLVKALEEFLVHGVKYAFPPIRGPLTRGIPTSHAAPPLKEYFALSKDPPPVWPDAEGPVRGYEFSPLYKSVPKAAACDRNLYELLALVDAIREGRARERELAVKELKLRLEKRP
ncbi:MAG: hypothetical protein AB7F20_07020 [Geoalkalibacter sp.]|uniref:hypothetical protein n=1 Tax=Geoalkalibacter sp. TaxID=3041440 RepID=UPI003D116FA7